MEQIDLTTQPIEKENLKILLRLVANEFTRPFSTDNQTYLFSSAVANYFLDTISIGRNIQLVQKMKKLMVLYTRLA
jgi:hypothetical protein